MIPYIAIDLSLLIMWLNSHNLLYFVSLTFDSKEQY